LRDTIEGSSADLGAYPRPQLRRGAWYDLSGQWSFTFDDGDHGRSGRWSDGRAFDRTITVPFPPESEASGVHDPSYHPRLWYQRAFQRPQLAVGERLILHFGAVDYRAEVWVNGQFAVQHEGGHTPFSADITELVGDSGNDIVTVRAEDNPEDLTQPRGKQYWEPKPGIIYYHRTSGIWQPVWLELVPNIYIKEIRWTPDLPRFGVDALMRLSARPPTGWRLEVRLSCDRRELVEDIISLSGDELRRTFLFEHNLAWRARRALRWSPDKPNLIHATIRLLDSDGNVADEVESYFGLREIAARDGRFHLNGQPIFLRMVLAQNYWPQSHLAAPSAEAIRREVELVKELGFNGVRIHQKIEDPRFLYWCDRLGVMVWADAANAFVYDDRSAERLTREWLEALRRDYSHPSIIAWVPHNESWGVPHLDTSAQQLAFVRALYQLTKAVDQTRPVLGNDGWSHAVGDILGVHDYAPAGDILRERYGTRAAIERTFTEIRPHHNPLLAHGHALGEEPVVISEFGGLSLKPAETEEWFGYGQFEDPERFLETYADLVGALLDSTALAGFCYTQLTDTEQETNGLVDGQRRPKFDMAGVRAMTSRPSRSTPPEVTMALLAEHHRRRTQSNGGGSEPGDLF
jgi:hypothetical protein